MMRSFAIDRLSLLHNQRVIGCALLLALLITWAAPTFVSAELSDEQAVTTGADALDSWWNYPWYDSSNDSIRRIDIKKPAKPKAPATGGWGGGSADGLHWLGWLLIAAVLGGLLYLLIRGFLNRESAAARTTFEQQPGTVAGVDRLEDLPFALEAPIDDLRTAARRAFEGGDYNRAIVYLYSHQLIELDKQQRIRLTRGKTNRQYVRELRENSALSKMLHTTMIAFEDVFFGSQQLSRERFEICWALTEELNRPRLQGAA